jgi:hypothetical protein
MWSKLLGGHLINITRHAIGPKFHVKVEYFNMKWTTNRINHENLTLKKIKQSKFLLSRKFQCILFFHVNFNIIMTFF